MWEVKNQNGLDLAGPGSNLQVIRKTIADATNIAMADGHSRWEDEGQRQSE
jgi:prepilin-type processing-associated H-X9-DG protein